MLCEIGELYVYLVCDIICMVGVDLCVWLLVVVDVVVVLLLCMCFIME